MNDLLSHLNEAEMICWSRDNKRATKLLQQYDKNLVVKWIATTKRNSQGTLIVGDYENPIVDSGRWGIYERYTDRKTHRVKEDLIYIVETEDEKYREVDMRDIWIMYDMDRLRKGFNNPDNYNVYDYVTDYNKNLEKKQDKKWREEAYAWGKDIYRSTFKKPYFTANTPWK